MIDKREEGEASQRHKYMFIDLCIYQRAEGKASTGAETERQERRKYGRKKSEKEWSRAAAWEEI